MRSIATLQLQYAHRFYGFKGEAQYLHGHTGVLTIEVEEPINKGVNMAFPCNEIKKTAWNVLQNFDHALILRKDDPLLPAILDVYKQTGIRYGSPQNTMRGPAFKTELCEAYPDCRLVVTQETMTVEGMIKMVYDLLKDKLNIVRLTFTSGANAATQEYSSHTSIRRCPKCGIALNKDGRCPKCGFVGPNENEAREADVDDAREANEDENDAREADVDVNPCRCQNVQINEFYF